MSRLVCYCPQMVCRDLRALSFKHYQYECLFPKLAFLGLSLPRAQLLSNGARSGIIQQTVSISAWVNTLNAFFLTPSTQF